MDLLRVVVAVILLGFVFVRNIDREDSDAGSQLVSGILFELSTLELPTVYSYDIVRNKALELAREKYPEGTFTPPDWFIEDLRDANGLSDVSLLKSKFLGVSKRLYRQQTGESYKDGRRFVRESVEEPDDDPEEGECKTCDGTGRVGDGRVFTDCLACGGDGIVDEEDIQQPRKEGDLTSTSDLNKSDGYRRSLFNTNTGRNGKPSNGFIAKDRSVRPIRNLLRRILN